MCGPITHAVTSRVLGLPVASGLWPDLGRTRRTRELTHGLPGFLVAAALGRRWLIGWCVHMAIDTLSHEKGEGAVGQRKWCWLP